jgi:hypothetical protein
MDQDPTAMHACKRTSGGSRAASSGQQRRSAANDGALAGARQLELGCLISHADFTKLMSATPGTYLGQGRHLTGDGDVGQLEGADDGGVTSTTASRRTKARRHELKAPAASSGACGSSRLLHGGRKVEAEWVLNGGAARFSGGSAEL